MNDSIKSVVRNYISVQMLSFYESFLERWVIFDLFDPQLPVGCPRKSKKNVVSQK